MLFRDFMNRLESQKKQNPIWFELYPFQPVQQLEIEAVERKLEQPIPDDYSEFLRHYGGGIMAFVHIYPLEELLKENNDHNIPNFLAISDNGCGDYYGYCTDRKEATIYLYEHEKGGFLPAYEDLFTFICKVGFR